MLVSFLISCGFGIISFILIFVMIKVKIEEKKHRERLVTVYKIFTKILLLFMGLSMLIMGVNVYTFLYKMTFVFVNVTTRNADFSKYISLSLVLLSFEPTVFFILKMVKKRLYKENEKFIEIQGTGTEMINKTILKIDNLPIKGIIHITNFFLVIYANSSKLLNIESGITTSSIYMTIATYYALDKVIDYFRKKYTVIWMKIDNRIFETDKIDKSVQFGLNELERAKSDIFDSYINTGKYGYRNEDVDSSRS